jgi:serine/threonine protein kinase
VTDGWPAPGALLAGRYRLIERLGLGGMSAVWRADDQVLRRAVAVKVLAGPLTGEARFRTVIVREARAVAQLSHRNIVAVHDYGEASQPGGPILPFIVMELLEGQPLQARLDRGPLPWPEAVEICGAVADALADAHRHGVVHRDVTPGNVVCTPGGVKVVDFGIAAPVGELDEHAGGLLFGTLEYVAPERLDGGPADAATDVFSLGVLLYELITGEPPFPAQSWDELATAHQAGPPPPPVELPADLARLCHECLAADPAVRPSAADVATALAAAEAPAPVAGAEAAPRRVTLNRTLELDSPRYRRNALVIGVALLASIAVTTIAILPFTSDSRRPATVAPQPSPQGSSPDAPPPVAPTTAAPGSAVEAIERVDTVVGGGLDRGEIRPDVATDFRNLLRDLERSWATAGGEQLSAAAAGLRRKVDERVREGGISQALARELRAAIDAVAVGA